MVSKLTIIILGLIIETSKQFNLQIHFQIQNQIRVRLRMKRATTKWWLWMTMEIRAERSNGLRRLHHSRLHSGRNQNQRRLWTVIPCKSFLYFIPFKTRMLIFSPFQGKYTSPPIRNRDQWLICKQRWWSPKCAIKIFGQSSWITPRTNIPSKCKSSRMPKSENLGWKKISWSTSWMKVSYWSSWIGMKNWGSRRRRWRVVQEKRRCRKLKLAQKWEKAVNCCAHLSRRIRPFRNNNVECSDLNHRV